MSTVIGGALILLFAKLFSTHAFSVDGFEGIPPLFQTHRNELIGLALLGSVGASAVVITTNFRKVFGLVSVLKGSLYGALIGVFAYSAVQFYATLAQVIDSSSDFSFGRTIALAATAFAYTISILFSLFLKNLGIQGFSELFHEGKEPPILPNSGLPPMHYSTPEPLSLPKESPRTTSIGGDKPKSQIWNVPHSQNPNFTGRKELLANIRQALDSGDKAAALTQAIKGLGGIGKTQIAIEYAYRNREHYSVVWWISSEESASLAGDYARLAVELNLASADTADQNVLINATWQWLSANSNWLLIFDNVESRDSIKTYLPPDLKGHIIITSRYSDWAGLASSVKVEELPPDEAVEFLIKRTDVKDRTGAAKLAETLGYLPLALEQAGAYIKNRGLDYERYLEHYQTKHTELLDKGEVSTEYPRSVATTWSVSIESTREISEVAPDLLRLLAFFAPDDIPLDIIREQKDLLPEKLKIAAEDSLKLDDAVGALMTFSLIDCVDDSISLHRLVQEVTRDTMSEGDAKLNAGAVVSILDSAFPFEDHDPDTWSPSGRLIVHVLESADYAQALSVSPEQTSSLSFKAGKYFRIRAIYVEARRSFERALELAVEFYGQDHSNVAAALNDLTTVLIEAGDSAGATDAYKRALEIAEKVHGKDHGHVATYLNNLAGVLKNQGDLTGAREMYERALKINRKVYGEDHPNVATSLNNLAGVLRAQGDLAGARDMYERALRIFTQFLGEKHPDTLTAKQGLNSLDKDS
ncbi:MAG: tetratricopeptide repeat protein [candidate division Zixibacteria bacterium]|nr:tetratricopeptide repeat protein [candidate division Zixibacteria bacterium]